ncbi:hypothetical protein Tco_1328689 [Tanacetum coccineum]
MKTSIRSDLHLEDAGGTDCLPTATNFKELARMGRKQRKDTVVTQEETQQDDSVSTPSNDPPLSGEDSMQKDAQAKEFAALKKRSKRWEREQEGRSDNEEVFDINDLHSDEVNVDMPVGKKQEQSAKEREVDIIVEGSAASTTIEEITLARTLIQIKVAKPKVLKSKSYEEIQNLFDNEMRIVNTFIPMDSEIVKSKKETEESSKGTKDELESDKSKKAESSEEKAKGIRKQILGKKIAGKEQQQESSKRQRMEDDKETDEHEEVEVDDEAELKKHLVIVKDDDIAIDVIPLATKPLPDSDERTFKWKFEDLDDDIKFRGGFWDLKTSGFSELNTASVILDLSKVKMDDPNITMEEYIRLEEEKARMMYNWETATYGKIWCDEDVHDLRSVETEFLAIFYNDALTSEVALSCEPTVSPLNNNQIDFRILFDESDG